MSIQQKKHHRIGSISPEYALLGFLIGGSCHGYDLHQRFTTELCHVWHLSQSQAYSILKRLEGHGDISAQIVQQDKLPARQMLRITAQGQHRFNEWLDGISTNARAIRLEFLTRLYFAQIYNPQKATQIYEAQCAEITSTIERLENLLAPIPLEQRFNRFSLDLRLRQMKLIRKWMSDIEAQIISPQD